MRRLPRLDRSPVVLHRERERVGPCSPWPTTYDVSVTRLVAALGLDPASGCCWSMARRRTLLASLGHDDRRLDAERHARFRQPVPGLLGHWRQRVERKVGGPLDL